MLITMVRTALALAAMFLLFQCVASAAPAPRAKKARPSLVLAALADLGTVYWRYDCKGRTQRWALGVYTFKRSRASSIDFRSGKLRRQRGVLPGTWTWFPFSRNQL